MDGKLEFETTNPNPQTFTNVDGLMGNVYKTTGNFETSLGWFRDLEFKSFDIQQ